MDTKAFQRVIYRYYQQQGRIFPWRKTRNPYHIFISEFMLQQTQTERVLKKYYLFIEEFPTFSILAQAPLQKIITVWQGLGYNRRCIYLRDSAAQIVLKFHGELPDSVDVLVNLPGIGKATASALVAFSYNTPTVFIETNIRQVFLHFFFPDRESVPDKDLYPLIEKALDRENPRIWYYALMDYGAMLKKKFGNLNKRSMSYKKQPAFEGSNRQVRGEILRTLVAEQNLGEYELTKKINGEKARLRKILSALEKEGFIKKTGQTYSIKE